MTTKLEIKESDADKRMSLYTFNISESDSELDLIFSEYPGMFIKAFKISSNGYSLYDIEHLLHAFAGDNSDTIQHYILVVDTDNFCRKIGLRFCSAHSKLAFIIKYA